jgi:serine protease Do
MGQAKPKEEVIIKKSGSGKEKTTIVIDGDRITVNGKPLAEYHGDKIVFHEKALEKLSEENLFEYRHEMELAQHEMQRAQREAQRALADLNRRSYNYRFRAPYAQGFKFEFDGDMELSKGEPVAFLGVGLEDADKGVRITDITEGSPASKAGLKENDIITRFNGTSVKSAEALTELVRSKKPNDEVELGYIKAGEKKERKMKLKLGETNRTVRVYSSSGQSPRAPRPPKAPMAPMPPIAPMAPMAEIEGIWAPDAPDAPMTFRSYNNFSWSGSGRSLGLRVQETDDSVGVKVLDVSEGSLAATAGIRENDVVTEIDGKAIRSTRDCAEAMQGAREKNNYNIRLLRGGSPMTVEVKIPKKLKKAEF